MTKRVTHWYVGTMFVFAMAAGFQDGVPNTARVQAMAAAFPVGPFDGTVSFDVPHAATAIGRWAVVRRDRAVAPRWSAERQMLFAGDVRLHNRRELGGALDVTACLDDLSDLELAWRAYLAWGIEAPRHLIGDFAFAVWDERRRALFATRDGLGVRPLYYTILSDGVAVASDVRQLLPLIRRPRDDVNPEALLGRFLPERRRQGTTFFRSISLLQPGHSLFIEEGRSWESRHWDPSVVPRNDSYADNCAQLLQLFRGAVRARLESDAPIVAHSSGGFDSSTIVMACRDVHLQESGLGPIIMASALTPGFSCDDSRYMEAIAAEVPFEQVTWSATEGSGSGLPEISLSDPVFRRGPGGGPRRDLEVANEVGAKVLLSGMYGDEVLFAGGIHLDMFLRRRWAELLRETVIRRDALGRGGWMLLESALGILPPAVALRARKAWLGRKRQAPDWFGPVLQSLSLEGIKCKPGSTKSWPSHVAYDLWERLTGNEAATALDGVVRYGSEAGIEMRLPYADIRIVEHLMTIPWDQRFPRGHLRRIGRDALGPLLPNVFMARRGQASWSAVFEKNASRASPSIAGILEDGTWRSAPFVDRSKARGLLRSAGMQVTHNPVNSWNLLLELAGIECWLRRLFCYNPAAR